MRPAAGKAPTTRQLVKKLRAGRGIIDDKVCSKIDVLGSMIGAKLRNGVPTGEIGITYFVREKIPARELSKAERIPPSVRANDLVWPTDVLVLPEMVNQAAAPVITHDGASQGSLSCFATANGRLYGLTCGHCLVGRDLDPTTPTDVRIWLTPAAGLVDCGRSVISLFAASSGLDGRGFVDCGVFSIENPALLARAKRATPLRTVTDLDSLLRTKVFGNSTLTVPSDPHGKAASARTALVIGVDQRALDHHSDLVLQVDAPGTFLGDSGMLWLSKDGRAIGIHTRGELKPQTVGSIMTTAMSAARAADKLGVKLLSG